MTSLTGTGDKVAVLGAGAGGTALAKVLADKGDPIARHCRRPELVTQINEEHVKSKYLPSATLPVNLRSSVDPEEVLDGASMVVFVAPAMPRASWRASSRARCCTEDKPVLQAVKDLMGRELTAEFESLDSVKAS